MKKVFYSALLAVVLGVLYGSFCAEPDLKEIFQKAESFRQAKNYAEAVKWYRKAADQGLSDAQFRLGYCYAKGEGVKQDRAEAVKWFRKAAEQGYAQAQYNLGRFYANGLSGKQDYVEAVKWYCKAAEQGYEPARKILKKLE